MCSGYFNQYELVNYVRTMVPLVIVWNGECAD